MRDVSGPKENCEAMRVAEGPYEGMLGGARGFMKGRGVV